MNQQIANRLTVSGKFWVSAQNVAAMLYADARRARRMQNKKFLQQQAAFWSARYRKERGLGE